MDSATKLFLQKERLISQAPFASERIGLAQTAEDLLDIAIELLDSRAEAQLRLEFGIGAKVARRISRVSAGAKAKKIKHDEIAPEVASHYLWAYEGWIEHPEIDKNEAKSKARLAARAKYEKLAGRSITWDALQRKLRPYLKK